MKTLKLTKQAEKELELVNAKFEDESLEYEDLNEREMLISDAGMYCDGAYIDNEFNDLKEWARELGICESETDSDAMFEKINKMIDLKIVSVKNKKKDTTEYINVDGFEIIGTSKWTHDSAFRVFRNDNKFYAVIMHDEANPKIEKRYNREIVEKDVWTYLV
jgi:hypothetical protein